MNPKDRCGAAKPNLSVLPFAPLMETIAALYEGRRKYGPWNWRGEQISETIYADAAIRHLMQFIGGEDIDPESGVHHISKAIAGLLIVRDAQMHGCSIDDRYVDQDLGIPTVVEKLAGINEKYPEQAETKLPLRASEQPDPHLGPRTDGLSVWADTVASGNGSYEITKEDEGKAVDLGNGISGTIADFCTDAGQGFGDSYPVGVEYTDDNMDYKFEWYSVEGRLRLDKTSPRDIVRVYYAQPDGENLNLKYELKDEKPTSGLGIHPDGTTYSWSATAASGNGSYEMTEEDVGKAVDLRQGFHGTIISWKPGFGGPSHVWIEYTEGKSKVQDYYPVDGYHLGAGQLSIRDIVRVHHV